MKLFIKRFADTNMILALAFGVSTTVLALPHARRGPTSQHFIPKRSSSNHPASRPANQRSIDSGRTTEIQTALIRQGYLTGEPTGKWDADTQAALQKMQGDNGWQTKLVPDSRAIIKLGLGPKAGTSSSSGSAHANSGSPQAEPGGESLIDPQQP